MSKTRNDVYAVSRVRSVEKNLLTREKMDKMVDSKTPEEAMKVLYDLEYGDGSDQVIPEHFEELLTEEHRKAYQFITDIAPERKEFVIFSYVYDYHNLKAILKAEFQMSDAKPMLLDMGSIDVTKLEVMVRERNFISMTVIMKNAVLEVIDTFARTSDPQLIDLILDKACYDDMLTEAGKEGNTFILGYVKLIIDTINLKTFVRLRQMGKSWDFFSKVYILGGNISEKLFIGSYDEPLEQIADKLLPFGLNTALTEGSAMLKETGRFTALEKFCDNKLIEYVKQAKYVSFGIEPLVAYIVAKENEIKSARIIMAGKIAGLSSEVIRERLRETYV